MWPVANAEEWDYARASGGRLGNWPRAPLRSAHARICLRGRMVKRLPPTESRAGGARGGLACRWVAQRGLSNPSIVKIQLGALCNIVSRARARHSDRRIHARSPHVAPADGLGQEIREPICVKAQHTLWRRTRTNRPAPARPSCRICICIFKKIFKRKKLSIRSASGRMRRDTLLSPGILALPPLSPPPFTISPGARPIISVRFARLWGMAGPCALHR
eukprot:scaffold7776_cov107-Isochrysis_galbana.AAC.1